MGGRGRKPRLQAFSLEEQRALVAGVHGCYAMILGANHAQRAERKRLRHGIWKQVMAAGGGPRSIEALQVKNRQMGLPAVQKMSQWRSQQQQGAKPPPLFTALERQILRDVDSGSLQPW